MGIALVPVSLLALAWVAIHPMLFNLVLFIALIILAIKVNR
jgi:hypothetical protein